MQSLVTMTQANFLERARDIGALWTYDYAAAGKGKLGQHALLTSGEHSNGYFSTAALLGEKDVRHHIVSTMVDTIKGFKQEATDYIIAGVPTGATELAQTVAQRIHAPTLTLQKEGRRIYLERTVPKEKIVLLIEDVVTAGASMKNTAEAIRATCPTVRFAPYVLAVLNRGELRRIQIPRIGSHALISTIEHKMIAWAPKHCPLCERGSEAVRPKDNWEAFIASQK